MASLSDFYQPPTSAPPAFKLAQISNEAGNASVDAGLAQSRMQHAFESRTLPDIVNRQAGRAAFFSSATGQAGQRANEDYVNQSGDVTLQLNRTLADLARQRILAGMGISI